MTERFQPGVHPDAESLNAFVEQALPAAEREQILMHMAECGRCRQVVFLAQEAAGSEAEPIAPEAVSKAVVEALPAWLGIWRWAWIPMGAVALLVGVAMLRISYRTRPDVSIARVAPSEQVAPQQAQEASAPAVNAPAAASAPPTASVRENKADSLQANSLQKDAKALDERRDAVDEEKAENRPAARQAVVPPSGQPKSEALEADLAPRAGGGGGAFNGNTVAVAKSKSVGGSEGLQRSEMALKEASAAGYSKNASSADAPADKASTDARAKTLPLNQVAAAPMYPAAPTRARMAAAPAASANYDSITAEVVPLKKAGGVRLPSGLTALSTAKAALRVVAVDPTGAMYLSEDGGVRWIAVSRQWTGRAVLLRVRGAEAAKDKLAAGALVAAATPTFELTTDDLQTWVSADGRTWTAATPAK